MSIPDEITNSEDIIDSRDIIARLDYLESEMECYTEDNNIFPFDWTEKYEGDKYSLLEKMTDEESEKAFELWEVWEYLEEYKALKALADEAEGYVADWQYGEALIRESYFEEYIEEFCRDVGYIPSDGLPWWIENHIDWEGVAREVKIDYTELDFDGVTYYAR